jgi:hypothetical protein
MQRYTELTWACGPATALVLLGNALVIFDMGVRIS